MMLDPVRFARRMSPAHEWQKGYATYSRNCFLSALISSFGGFLLSFLLSFLLPDPGARAAKGAQIVGAVLAFSAAVIPKPMSWDEELPAERANEAGLLILTFIGFALGCYGTLVAS